MHPINNLLSSQPTEVSTHYAVAMFHCNVTYKFLYINFCITSLHNNERHTSLLVSRGTCVLNLLYSFFILTYIAASLLIQSTVHKECVAVIKL